MAVMTHNLKRMRLLCGLRQIDVWAGTGIPVGKISLAEQARVRLSEPEEKLLVSFLRRKWDAIQAAESDRPPLMDSPLHRGVAESQLA